MSTTFTKLLNGIECPTLDPYDFDELHLKFNALQDYDKVARCLIAAAILGHTEIEDYLHDMGLDRFHFLGHIDKFTEDDLVYCENVLIPNIIENAKVRKAKRAERVHKPIVLPKKQHNKFNIQFYELDM